MKVRLFQILYILINIYFASDFQRYFVQMQFFRLTLFLAAPEACGVLAPQPRAERVRSAAQLHTSSPSRQGRPDSHAFFILLFGC